MNETKSDCDYNEHIECHKLGEYFLYVNCNGDEMQQCKNVPTSHANEQSTEFVTEGQKQLKGSTESLTFNSCAMSLKNEGNVEAISNHSAMNNHQPSVTHALIKPLNSVPVSLLPSSSEKLSKDFSTYDTMATEKLMTKLKSFEDSQNLKQNDDALMQPLSERWSPLGANYDDVANVNSEFNCFESDLKLHENNSLHLEKQLVNENANELTRLQNIEEEQELLTSSLMALTSHFAQVQLRVRQIVEAPIDERDKLLKDLEVFAFQGIPESASIRSEGSPGDSVLTNTITTKNDDKDVADIDGKSQTQLIEKLKEQLTELEQTAYQSGAPVLPQNLLLEKQKIIIDELKSKLNFKVNENDFPELTAEQLKIQVDNAIGEFLGPWKMKEKLVVQLKTQITDLERFIAFLQCDADENEKFKALSEEADKFNEAYNSYAAKKKNEKIEKTKLKNAKLEQVTNDNVSAVRDDIASNDRNNTNVRESLNSKAQGLLDRASMLMQMFATTHLSARKEQFQKNSLKKTSRGNHWGDLRAQLEVDIQEVASLAATLSCDQEKLSKINRIINKKKRSIASYAVNEENGALITVPPSKTAASNLSVRRKNLNAPYTNSSDSDDDACDLYDWNKSSASLFLFRRGDSISTIKQELTKVVRKNFAKTLQQLIQHGLRTEIDNPMSTLMVPFIRCLNPSFVYINQRVATPTQNSYLATNSLGSVYRSKQVDEDQANNASMLGYGRTMHAWELILEYYFLKNGDKYNNTPARRLSQSFNLNTTDLQGVTPKQSLLSTIDMIVTMHRPYKRSYNTHFKAFICAGLNTHHLVEWLNLILSNTELIDMYYLPNSYVARTGFRDSLRSIDSLMKYDFNLPVDFAVRHFRNL